MFPFNRRKLLEVLGKGTAALGLGFSFLGTGCGKKESAVKEQEGAKKRYVRQNTSRPSYEEMAKSTPPPRSATKKIVALVCGSEGGQCETFTRAAAIGAGELGIPTEIIQAATLDVNVYEGNPDDDVPWIHERTLLDDVALICAVPCYHIRANSLFYAINDRMNQGIRQENLWATQIFRVGAVIGVGGSGYDGWASLTNLSTEIYMQHTRKLVDQVLFTFCGLKEWNLWMQQGKPLTSNTHKQRVNDTPYEETRTMYGEQVGYEEWYRMAIERAKQLGRNVANAMNMPIEEVKYLGEEAGVGCPLCHCNILLVPENLPYIYCPVCAVRGTIVVDRDKMKVEWNMNDVKMPRLHFAGQLHHADYLSHESERRAKDKAATDALKDSIFSQSNTYAKIIRPA